MGKMIDMTGWKMWEHGVPDSKLIVLSIDEEHSKSRRKKMWKCECSCGSNKYVFDSGYDIRNGKVKSCGCLKAKRNKEYFSTHGDSDSRLYNIWCKMKTRCNNQNDNNYKNYGARGIKICNEWVESYEAFRDWAYANGYQEYLTIDRIDVNGNYEPNNCRWADSITQANNRTNNHHVEYNGETITVSELAKITNNKYNTISTRLNHLNYSVEDCVNIEVGQSEKGKRYIEFNGKRQTVTEWAHELGMSPSTLFTRLNNSKWTIEKALTEPVNENKKRR